MKATKFLLPLLLSAGMYAGGALAETSTAPDSNTQVQMQHDSATAPKVDIEAPDVNVTTPGGTSTTRETYTERNNTTVVDSDDADTVAGDNTWLFVVLAVLAVAVIAILFASSRRSVYD